MDIVKLDTEELERYFAQHTLDDATVGKALEKFERAFNLDTKLADVKKLEQNLQDRVSPESYEYFCMKLLSYVVEITNRNLPVDAEESQELLTSRYLGAEDGAWAQAALFLGPLASRPDAQLPLPAVARSIQANLSGDVRGRRPIDHHRRRNGRMAKTQRRAEEGAKEEMDHRRHPLRHRLPPGQLHCESFYQRVNYSSGGFTFIVISNRCNLHIQQSVLDFFRRWEGIFQFVR